MSVHPTSSDASVPKVMHYTAVKHLIDTAIAKYRDEDKGSEVDPNNLGNSAALDVGTTINTVAAGDDPRIVAGGTATQPDEVMVTVAHGDVASTVRPVGPLAVYWLGSVEPTNAIDGDMWWSA